MIIDYYTSSPVSVNKMLGQGIALGAFIPNVGWSHAGLVQVSKKYNMSGKTYDLSTKTSTVAFAELSKELKNGPVIVSVPYKLDPKSKLPHLIVVDGIKDGVVHYNDPSAKSGDKQISAADFQKAWKKRFIVIRPA